MLEVALYTIIFKSNPPILNNICQIVFIDRNRG